MDKRKLCIAMLAALCLALAGCRREAAPVARAGGDSDPVRLLAVNVGKGDALILRVGDFACLVDTGRPLVGGKVRSALKWMGVERLDAVFVTHTDGDHVGALPWLTDGGIPVGAWYAPAMYTGVEAEEHPMLLAAEAAGAEVTWLRRGDAIPAGDGATLRVLAPASLFEDKDDNNSLVMLLESAQGKLLLTGDMELPEEAELLAGGDDLKCDVLKVPNHGDDDTTSAGFANACAAQVAVISTSAAEKPGTPDPDVVSRLEAAGSAVVVTEDGELGILVTLKDGVAAAEGVDIDAPAVTGLSIASVDAKDDRIVLSASADVDLTGFCLLSTKGNELFIFPDGTSVASGDTLTLGSRATEGDYDLLWDDKRVVNKKKADEIRLYDNWGRLVDALGNGKE